MRHKENGKEYWSFPGGGVEEKESAEDAVLREVKEETTLEVKIEKLLYRTVCDHNSEQFFYLCSYISGEPKINNNEALRMKENKNNLYNPEWRDIKDLSRLLLYPLEIRDRLIKDAKTNFKNFLINK